MDCANARLLLSFQRPGELDEAERQALAQHFDGCPDCAALAQSEGAIERTLASAMQAVSVPAGLRGQILGRLQRRRPVPWPWIAAAASVLLAVGLGAYVWLFSKSMFDAERFIAQVEAKSTEPGFVKAWFEEQGQTIALPRQFNPAFLDFYDAQTVQGRQVAHLLFAFPGNNDNRAAVAHVYVLPRSSFKFAADLPKEVSRSHHTFEFWPSEEFLYCIVYTGGSLTPFLLGNDI